MRFITQVPLKVTKTGRWTKTPDLNTDSGGVFKLLYMAISTDVLHCAFDPQDKVRMHEKQGIKLYQVRGDIYKNVRPAANSNPIWFRSSLAIPPLMPHCSAIRWQCSPSAESAMTLHRIYSCDAFPAAAFSDLGCAVRLCAPLVSAEVLFTVKGPVALSALKLRGWYVSSSRPTNPSSWGLFVFRGRLGRRRKGCPGADFG